MSRPVAFLGMMLAVASIGGCDTLLAPSDNTSPTAAHPGAGLNRGPASDDGREALAAYVSFLEILDSTDEQSWQAILEHTRAAYEENPDQENRLRLALVMSRADKQSTDAGTMRERLERARRLLDEALADTTPTPALVRTFTELERGEIDTRLALYEEMQSLRSQLAKAHQESQAAQRIRNETEARMRRIDAALAEANAKLEAVMNIEREVGPQGKETFP